MIDNKNIKTQIFKVINQFSVLNSGFTATRKDDERFLIFSFSERVKVEIHALSIGEATLLATFHVRNNRRRPQDFKFRLRHSEGLCEDKEAQNKNLHNQSPIEAAVESNPLHGELSPSFAQTNEPWQRRS